MLATVVIWHVCLLASTCCCPSSCSAASTLSSSFLDTETRTDGRAAPRFSSSHTGKETPQALLQTNKPPTCATAPSIRTLSHPSRPIPESDLRQAHPAHAEGFQLHSPDVAFPQRHQRLLVGNRRCSTLSGEREQDHLQRRDVGAALGDEFSSAAAVLEAPGPRGLETYTEAFDNEVVHIHKLRCVAFAVLELSMVTAEGVTEIVELVRILVGEAEFSLTVGWS